MYKFIVFSLLVAAVVGQMTQSFRDNILRDHNAKRRQATNAANMIELRYDMVLEQVAQNYLAKGCAGGFQHNPNRGCDYTALGGKNGGSGSCASVGENWYSGTPDNTTGVDVVIGGATSQWTDGTCSSWASPPLHCASNWCSEKQNFYQTGSDSYGACSQFNGEFLHFTQVMWATTAYVGCGYTEACGTVCDYATAGNINLPATGSIVESNLWKIGTPCSSCPSGYTTCDNGLCAASASTTPTSCAADTTNKPTNGNIGTCGSRIAVGSSCTQVCNTGYTLTSGSLSRQCSSSGTLGSVTAVCSAITCAGETIAPTNGNSGTCSTSKSYGQVCYQACNTGYTLSSGSLARTCGTTGSFGSTTAVCTAVTCPADSSTKPTNGNAGTCATSKSYGQTCQTACNSGYTLSSGSLVRTCGSSGTFSSVSAVCTATATTAAPTTTPAPTTTTTRPPTTTLPPTTTTTRPPTTTPAPTTTTQPPATLAASYCTSGPLSPDDTEFGPVQLIGYASQINDTDGCPGMIGPSIFTNLSASLAIGQNYTINFLRTTCGDYYLALIGAWIDWNQDRVWEDSEKLFPYSEQIGQISYTFTVPTNAALGTTRLRLQVQEIGSYSITTIDPCAMFEWGDTKDYTVVVRPATAQVQCTGNANIKPANGVAGTCLTTMNYGEVCTQRCNSGYMLTSGSLSSTCGANGAFTPSTAVCTAISSESAEVSATNVCVPDNEVPVNGGQGTCAEVGTLGSTCLQTCNPGFTLRAGSSLERECTLSGYSTSNAICE